MDHRSRILPWDLECMLCDETAEPRALPLSLLEDITNGFSDEQQIGKGEFTVVYKGNLENSIVSVKKLSNTYMYEKEFQREVECLMMVKHKNIIRFLGYCADTQGNMAKYNGKFVMADVQQRLLCFEYHPKGSLYQYIIDNPCGHQWSDRYQIIRGICQGLHYLHQKNIIHLDLNPTNILLDHNLVPKITDFGKSRYFVEIQDHDMIKITGTPGYLAPESYNRIGVTYQHSYQLDIYSLGVIIIEILTGEMGYHDVDEVVESWSSMFDTSESEAQQEQVPVCAEIGLECTNFNPGKRPDTQHIISRLDETESTARYIETGMTTSEQSGSKTFLSLQYLKYITKNFCDERILGKGGFGVVYKGLLHNGEMVAVKKILQAIPTSQTQFENEINLLIKLKHHNIVRLIGYCYETQHLHTPYEGKSVFAWNTQSLLCLECLPNGGLDKYISDASTGLNWHTRYKVIEGISYGLQYLHGHSNEPIIHLDLKPANILLDGKMLPKITDFGISRLFDQNQSICTASTRGTLGYMPPEFLRGIITPMWDIFSLGVIIMEIITGHRDYPRDIRKSAKGFIELELQKWRNKLQKEPGYTMVETDCQQIERCIQIGLICVNDERTKRPTMKKIINMLQGSESMDWYITNELSEP
uniref:Uncharacterized protein n=1 Tax=Avena sativa TaxID=4498 RepID=A0ACD5YMH4_AVESA